MRLMYSSLPVRLPRGALDELGVVIGPVPGRPTGMAIFANEDDIAMFTVYGMAGVEPPTGLNEMLGFAADFTPAHVVAAIRESDLRARALSTGCQRPAGDATTR